MKTQIRALVIAVGMFCAASAFAQTASTNAVNAANAAKANATAASAPAKMAGGAGKVWVNSSSKTYHCEGSKFYGKTKSGEYMSEADAKAKGNHAVKGKVCGK
jgi:hypothetical protein